MPLAGDVFADVLLAAGATFVPILADFAGEVCAAAADGDDDDDDVVDGSAAAAADDDFDEHDDCRVYMS